MQELTPGIRHWSALHPKIEIEVSSYWLPDLGVLLDPIAVPDEVEGVEEILLTNRHHVRDAFEARERFGVVSPLGGPTSSGMLTLHCPPSKVHALASFLRAKGAGGVTVTGLDYVFARDNPLYEKLAAKL